MGNAKSSYESDENEDIWWTNGKKTVTKDSNIESGENSGTRNQRGFKDCAVNTEHARLNENEGKKETLDEFKVVLERKHEKRRQLIAEKRKEMQDLRNEVALLKKENEELKRAKYVDKGFVDMNSEIERLRAENEMLKAQLAEVNVDSEHKEEFRRKNNELRINVTELQTEIQRLNEDNLNSEKERSEYENHVSALKEVIRVLKQLLVTREEQVSALKNKVESIEQSLASKEFKTLSLNIQAEYEKQLESIRNLRALYEERQRAHNKERQELKANLEATREELEKQLKIKSEYEERIKELEEDNSRKYDEIMSLQSNHGLAKAECRQYEAELSVINQLFSQILISFNNNQEVDLEKLIKLLEEHHNLLQDIVINEESTAVSSALPKVLLDLINRTRDAANGENEDELQNKDHNRNNLETIVEESESQTSSLQLNSPSDIVENLPKVWRVLIELLSQQCPPVNVLTEGDEKDGNPCYKLVQTPKGPNLVLSVSQTFIRLKDLILEKKSLEKELNHLKHLNTHLETRLQDQEKRLEMVSNELSSTWHIVGKLQKQHQVLHTQEQILRYELAQKRKLLNKLKEELESSREKWLEAREKNSNTEKQWRQLRTEFASRKKCDKNDFNNSIESGYSDEKEVIFSDEEPGYETDISECNQKSPTEPNTDTDLENKETQNNDFICENQNSSEEEKNDNATISDDSAEVTSNIDSSSILNLIQSELSKIVGDDLENLDNCKANEENHSITMSNKTDLVQSIEKTILPELRSDLLDSISQNPSASGQLVQSCLTDQHYLPPEAENPNFQEDRSTYLNNILFSSDTKEHEINVGESNTPPEVLPSISEENQLELDNLDNRPKTKQSPTEPFCEPSSSKPQDATSVPSKTLEQILISREERLKRMEDQCEKLFTKAVTTSQKSIDINNKLENLHEIYGEKSEKN